MKSLPGYFEQIKNKIYLDRYPESIIRVNDLKDKIFVEFGGGLGNDAAWLLSKGFNPKYIFFIENDDVIHNKVTKKLKKFGAYSSHILFRDVRKTGLKENSTDFVYANNMLHCLETKNNVTAVLKEAMRILHNRGILFGRTLLDEIDRQKLQDISNPKNEEERFALMTTKALEEDILIGFSENELRDLTRNVGFRKLYTEIKPWKWKPTTDFYFRFEK